MDDIEVFEEEARSLFANPALTPLERRLAFERLLAKYHVLDEYRRAWVAFVRRMQSGRRSRAANPEEIIREILASPEFGILRLAVFAMLLAVLYDGGPRSAWVPTTLLPLPVMSVGLRL
jgi:hypothetical protein